ncbi:MAG: glycosidase [Bacillota bacterium]|nr:glycosidase [Bacillota bacterium]
MTHSNTESIFDDKIKTLQPILEDYVDYDLVIGLPFINEKDALLSVLTSIDDVLNQWIGRRHLIVCAGDACGEETLQAIETLRLNHPCIAFLMPPKASGRGMSIRAFIEIAQLLEADLLIFSSNMATAEGPGINVNGVESLLTPIQGNYDIVLGSLRGHLGIDSIAHMFAAPILETFYGSRVSDPLGGIYAISHDFVEELASEAKFWTNMINGAGIDFWMITRAVVWNKTLCEVNMGGVIKQHNLEKRNKSFSEIALTILESIKRDSAIWLRERLIVKVADMLARSEVVKADVIHYPLSELLRYFRSNFDTSVLPVQQSLQEETIQEIKRIQSLDENQFFLSDELWVSAIFSFITEYSFGKEEYQHDLIKALTALYNGRVASYTTEMMMFNKQIQNFSQAEQDDLMVRKMDSIRQRLVREFWHQKPALTRLWARKYEQAKPPLVPLGYMEYVPGKPIVIPKQIIGKDRRMVHSDNVFKELRKQYDEKFNSFTTEKLGLANTADSQQVVDAVEKFMLKAEKTIDELLPGDLFTDRGLKSFCDALFALVPNQKIFTLNNDLLREMIMRFPPINLMIPLGYYKPADLLANMDSREAVTYANLVESWSYTDRDLVWLADQLKPESFEWTDIKVLLITDVLPFGPILQTQTSNLNKITGCMTIKRLEEGKNTKFIKLKYFNSIMRRLCVAEQYSRLFYLNVCERKNIGLKVKNSLLNLRKGDEFSAYNIFENISHRLFVRKMDEIAEKLILQGKNEEADTFKTMVHGYGLSQVLENTAFLTCSTWSWASYSYKGGLKMPTPLTTSVESRWFNHDFLEALYRELGYKEKEIQQTVYRFIQAGKSEQNILDTLLPARPKDITVVVQESTDEPSKNLQRFEGNPLLEPIDDHAWECKYVLNPGALRIKDKVYLFYRAVGNDDVSHIGLAITDGYRVLERLSEPIFSPAVPEEAMGVEDPRLIIINDRIWMLYTAYDGNMAQIAAASIGVSEFVQGNYRNWKREGLAFKNIWDKDAILFPEKIKDKYILYHRIEPSMWVTYMNTVRFPCREKHAIILGPRPGRMWDSLKIGAGAQPLKTKYGWLLIYHGVDHNYVYRLGVLLVDLLDPQKVLYRSPNSILEPVEDYEIGLSGAWVPNVVFTCGAVSSTEREVLEDEDEVLVYYGAADTAIGLATATVADLIPEPFRQVK